jgi:thioredoxin-like negative regulator of GroEL
MMPRRRFLAAVALATLSPLVTRPALANPVFSRYSKSDFDRFLASGRPVVVHVHADWCPVCRQQQTSFESIGVSGFKGAHLVRVDFDTEKAFLRQHNVRSQSTILVFKGGVEVARAIGETSAAAITATLSSI